MRRQIVAVLISLLLFTSVQLPCWAETITILHTNDTHSCLLPYGPSANYGGIARMATLIKQLKSRDPNVLVFNSGDLSVGTFEFNKYLGYPEFKIMQDMYDAMCLGNHEFDLGIDTLAGVLSGALAGDTPITMPILCANIDLSKYPSLKSFVKPYVVVDLNGTKIGVLGVITSDSQYYSSEVLAVLKNPYKAAAAKAATLRGQGCKVVVCLSHLGKLADVNYLSKVPGIDVIVGGHSHDALKTAITANGKIIVQAGAFGNYLGELKIDFDGQGVSLESYKLRPITPGIEEDPIVAATVRALKKGIEADPRFGTVCTERVAAAAWDLEKDWNEASPYRDTALGNLVADAVRDGLQKAQYPVDLALEANGYIGHKVYKGKVVGNDILRAVPYGYDPTTGLGFKIVVAQLFGQQILAGLEFTVAYVEYDDSFCMQASGLTFAYDSSKPPAPLGSLSRLDPTSVRIQDYPISPYGLYKVAMNERVYDILVSVGLEPFSKVDTGLFEYNLVHDHMKSLGRLRYVAQGRIIDRAAQ